MPELLRASGLLAIIAISTVAGLPQFHVNLDEPPQTRWREVTRYYKELFPALMQAWRSEILKGVGQSGINQWLKALKLPGDFNEEIEGIVKEVNHPDVTFDIMLLWNAMYELNHPTFCTGILAAMENGTVVHGRNMDYGFLWWYKGVPMDLDPVTHEVIFMRNGKQSYISTGWPGHLGIHTGMRFGAWSIEINLRPNTYESNLAGAEMGGLPHGIVVRMLMNTVQEYDQVVEKMWQSNLAAPCYVILAGTRPYQGTIITKDRNLMRLAGTPPMFELGPNQWHLAQTNDDLGAMPLDIRRPIINSLLSMHKPKDVGPEFMLGQMRLPPAFNQATKFTSIYIPATGEHYTFLADDRAVIGPRRNSVSPIDRFRLRGWQRHLAPAPTNPPHKGPPRGFVDTQRLHKKVTLRNGAPCIPGEYPCVHSDIKVQNEQKPPKTQNVNVDIKAH